MAAGSAQSSSSSQIPDFALVRYNDRGRVDSGFGSAGRVTTDFFGSFDQAKAIALQSDGKIVLAGVANPDFTLANSDFALARYSPDGSLDWTFGSGAKVITNFLGAADEAKALAVEPNGKLVAAGNTNGLAALETSPSLITTPMAASILALVLRAKSSSTSSAALIAGMLLRSSLMARL